MHDWEKADRYAEAHTTTPLEALRRLGEETEATTDAPQMSVGALEGAFLRFLVAIKQPRLVLDSIEKLTVAAVESVDAA